MEITLKEAEEIVEANSNLRWNGWTIEALKSDHNACLLTTGVFHDGNWYKRQVFSVKENGTYDLPKAIVTRTRHRS